MTNFGTLGSVGVDVTADLSKLNAQLQDSIRMADSQGQKIGRGIGQGVEDGIKDPLEQLRARFRDQMDKAGKEGAEAFGSGVRKGVTDLADQLKFLGDGATSLGKTLAIGVTAPLAAFSYAAIAAYGDIDSLRRGLTAVAGDANLAGAEFEQLKEVAKLPGLGLQEAVKGSINLQAFGFSAQEAKDSLQAFGNAIATVGGGRDELGRVITQLGQMAGAGKVLNQDLRPIIQTVPQVAGILKREFGPEVLGAPAETFEKLGLSSKDAIAVIVRELNKLPPVTGGIKNDLENFSDATKLALAQFGEAMAPLVHSFVEVAVPAIKLLADTFTALPGPIQGAIFLFGTIAAATGPALYAFGKFTTGVSEAITWLEKFRAMRAAASLVEVGEGAASAASGIGGLAGIVSKLPGLAFNPATLAIGAAGFALYELYDAANKAPASMKEMEDALGGAAKAAKEAAKSEDEYRAAIEARYKIQQQSLGNPQPIQDLFTMRGIGQDALNRIQQQTGAVDLTGPYGQMTKAAQDATAASDALVKKQAELKSAYKEAVAVVADLTRQQAAGKDVSTALALATVDLKKAHDALNPTIKETKDNITTLGEAYKSVMDRASQLSTNYTALQGVVDKLLLQQAAGKDVTVQLAVAYEQLQSAQDALVKATHDQFLPTFDLIAGRQTAAVIALQGTFEEMQKGVGVIQNGVAVYRTFGDTVNTVRESLVKVPQVTREAGDGFTLLGKYIEVTRAGFTGATADIQVFAQTGVQHITTLADVIRDYAGAAERGWIAQKDLAQGAQQVEQWVKDATIAIVNGIRVLDDDKVAKHNAAQAGEELASSNGNVANSYDRIASSAAAARQQMSLIDELESSPVFGPGSGASSNFGATTFNQAVASGKVPNVGDFKDVQFKEGNVGGGAVEITTWTEQDIQTLKAILALQDKWKTAQTGSAATVQQSVKVTTQQAAATQGLNSATASTTPTVEDLTNQLWDLIDAGKGSSQAAWDIRAKLQEMTAATDDTGSAVQSAASTIAKAGASIIQTSAVLDTVIAATVKSTTARIAAIATAADMPSATVPNASPGTVPRIWTPNPTAPATYQPSSDWQTRDYEPDVQWQNGVPQYPGVTVNIPPGNAQSIGAALTTLLQQLAGYN